MLCKQNNEGKALSNVYSNKHTVFENFHSESGHDKLRRNSSEFPPILNKSPWHQNDEYFPINNRRINDLSVLQHLTHAPYAIEDQKIFLYGSQVLERLNGIIKRANVENIVNTRPHATKQGKSSYLFLQHGQQLKEVTIYYNKLKKLLVMRYLLLLRREYIRYVKQSEEFFKDCFILTSSEKIKGKTFSNMYPSQLTNSDTLNVSGLIMLLNQLSKMIHQWQIFFLGFQKVATIFHPGFNIYLYNIFCCTDSSLHCLYENFIHFICINLHIVMEKLRLTDLNNSTFDFLPTLLDISRTLKSFTMHKRNSKSGLHYCKFITKSFRSMNAMKIQEFSSTNILSIFAHLQAILASDKIMRTIATDIQKEFEENKGNTFFIWLSTIPSNMKQTEDTSDYCSGSVSEVNTQYLEHLKASHINVLPTTSVTSNVISTLNTLIHKNESFILRYLFAIEQSEQANNDQNTDENRMATYRNIVSRKIWKYSSNQLKNNNCPELKKAYWVHFWKKANQYFIKLLMEVPYQQFGDLFAGSLLMCRETSITTLMTYLKQNCEMDDYRDDSQSYIHNLFYCTFLYAVQVSWDKRLCSALTMSHFHRCSVVPLENGNSGTDSGNSLCVMLQPLFSMLTFFNSTKAENVQFTKTLHQLTSSLKYCQNWAVIRQRTFLSSWNISQHLLTTCDIMRFLCLMDLVIIPEKLNCCSARKSFYSMSSVAISLEKIYAVHAEIKNLNEEMPRIMHKKAYFLTMDTLNAEIFGLPCWKFKRRINGLSNCMEQIIEQILSPVFETVELNKGQSHLIKYATSAVVKAYIDFLKRKKVRFYGIRLINTDVHELTVWLKKMNLSENKSEEVEIFKLIENLHYVLNTMNSGNMYARRLVQSRNSVCPLLMSSESFVA